MRDETGRRRCQLSLSVSGHLSWSGAASIRFAWTLISIFVVESIVFAVAALPAVAFFRWHIGWDVDSASVKTFVLAMALVPSYAIFAVLLMWMSAMSMRLLGWRPTASLDLAIVDLDWPLCNWARYQISAHIVAFFAGGLLRATPVWSAYLRWNGARLGRRVWVNSLGVTDHCLLDFGDDVVVGAGVHLSGHTVERGRVKTAPVAIGSGSTIGVNAHIEIGVTIGKDCQIGSLSMVPKFSTVIEPGTYVGVPIHRIGPRHANSDGSGYE